MTKASEETLKNKNTIYYNVNDPNDCISEYETTIKFTDILGMIIMLTLPFAALKGMLSVKMEEGKG